MAAVFLAALGWGAWEASLARTFRRERAAVARAAGSAYGALAGVVDRLADDAARDDPVALRRDLLTDARAYFQGIVGTPTEVATSLTWIATIDRALGRKAEAVAGYRAAIDLWRRLAGDRLGDVDLAERLAGTRVLLALALDPKAAGPDADDALENLTAAGETYLALADRDPEQPRHRRDLARVFLERARIEQALKRDRAALASTRQSIRLLEELGWADPDASETRLMLATAHGLLARLLGASNDGLEAAAMALDRAVGLLDGLTGPRKDSPRVAFDTASRLAELAQIQSSLGSPAPATAALARAMALLEDLAARHPAVASYRGELASAYNLDVELLRGLGKREEAKSRAEQARAMLERLIVERPDEPRYVASLATSRHLLGRLLALEGKTAEALKSFRNAADAIEGMKDADRTGADSYSLACDLSLGLSLIGVREGGKPIADADDPALSPADRTRRDLYARRAVEALRQAVARGFDDPDLYRRDPALDPLRPREDFKKLLEELTANPEAG
jgi:tetratricopeptide (TPR) repeat protein